jgi:hypothetical protein
MNKRGVWLLIACLWFAAVVSILIWIDLYRWLKAWFTLVRIF